MLHFAAFGRFIAAYALAEGAAHAVARALSGMREEKARIIFCRMPLEVVIKHIRSMLEIADHPKAALISESLRQLDPTGEERHKLAHREVIYGRGVLKVSDCMTARPLSSITYQHVWDRCSAGYANRLP